MQSEIKKSYYYYYECLIKNHHGVSNNTKMFTDTGYFRNMIEIGI